MERRETWEARWWGWATAAVVVAGVAPRLVGLTAQSLWYDELFSVWFSRPELSVADIVARYAVDFHPLLYPLLLHGWMAVFGWTELSARLLSGIAGAAGVAAAAWLGRRLAGPAAGLALAVVTATNPFQLQYSHEVRPYAVTFLLAAFSWAALLELIERPGWRSAALWVLPTALVMHTHYYAVAMAGAQLVAAVVVETVTRRRRAAYRWLVGAGAAVGLLLLPWLGPTLRAAGVAEYWPPRPRPTFVFEYLADYFGRSAWLGGAAALLLAALPVLLWRRGTTTPADGGREARAAAVFGVACALVLSAAYLRSILAVPMMLSRFTMVLVPAVLALVVLAGLRLPGRWTGAAVVTALVAGSVAQLAHDGWPHWPPKEQWREATSLALEHDRCSQRVLMSGLAPGFQFYASQRTPAVTVEEPTLDVLKAASDRLDAESCLWLLVARDVRPQGPPSIYLSRHFRLEERLALRGVDAELWRPRPQRPRAPVTAP